MPPPRVALLHLAGPTPLSEDLVRHKAAITGFKELIIIVGGKSASCSRNPVFIKPRTYPSHLMEEDTVATKGWNLLDLWIEMEMQVMKQLKSIKDER
jgi:hypothetical protein